MCLTPCRQLLKYVLALALFLIGAGPSFAVGRLADLEVVDRSDGRVLPVIESQGQYWIVGTPGHEYQLRLRNRAGARVLAVTSVDGVNVVTGESASPMQSGYVLDGGGSVEIAGWRKSLATTAAFYFTDLGDAYATRTGRPENVGVIGVALFRERVARIDEQRPLGAPMRKESAAGAAANAAPASAEDGRVAQAPVPAPSLGTGHGRHEANAAQRVHFDRATSQPAEIITVRYDRRENLIAMGVIRPTPIAGTPRPFPDWSPGFVPDPPTR